MDDALEEPHAKIAKTAKSAKKSFSGRLRAFGLTLFAHFASSAIFA
jgi:hypothetical protein